MARVFVIGGATLDTIIQYEEMETLIHQRAGFNQSYLLLEEGKKIEVVEQESASGGGATNTAVAFKRLGYEVSLFCKLGKDAAGEVVKRELDSYGLDLSAICYDDKIGTATSFVVPSLKGDRTVFAYRGANANLLGEDLPLAKITGAKFLYITSLSRASAARLPEIVNEAKIQNVKVAVNPGISQLKRGGSFLKDSLAHIDALILNEEEAKTFMASLLEEERASPEAQDQVPAKLSEQGSFAQGYFNLREFFQVLLNLGVKLVAVTNGSEGVYVATREQLYFHKAPSVKVTNTLGAGDAFGSGFIGTWYATHDLEYSIRAGVANSVSVISYPDAKSGLLSLAEIEKRIRDLPPQLLTRLAW